MKKPLFALGLLLASAPAFSASRPLVVCNSIDITHRPHYSVRISLLDETHPDLYAVEIEKMLDLAGEIVSPLQKEGKGHVGSNDFNVEFGEFKDGQFVKNGESVMGFRMRNGFFKGDLFLQGNHSEELTCHFGQ